MAGGPSTGGHLAMVLGAFLALQSWVLLQFNQSVPRDYMDEIFHGPQAREYCRGAFSSWHPKITTFPGIYYLGAVHGWGKWAAHAVLGDAVPMDAACSTPYLRSLNVLLSAACLLVLRATLIAQQQRQQQQRQQQQRQQQQQQQQQQGYKAPAEGGAVKASPGKGGAGESAAAAAAGGASAAGGGPDGARGQASATLWSLALAAYPLHWFFSFLFYTDVASTLFLLLCHLQAVKRSYLSAGLAGCAALLCRQTNAVWVAFVLGESVLDQLGMLWAPAAGAAAAAAGAGGGAGGGGGLRAPGSEGAGRSGQGSQGGAGSSVGSSGAPAVGAEAHLVDEVLLAVRGVAAQAPQLLLALWPLLLAPAAFVAFLAANGGAVVLGDKEAHTPVKHGAQLLYFAGWSALMLWPLLLGPAADVLRAVGRRPAVAAAAAAVAAGAAVGVAHVSTLAHPYLLADNRHYTFYLWRRLLDRHPAARYALAPAYAACWAVLLAALRRRVSRLWVLGFAACLVATLLPAWLLELRYFTPGLYLIALHLQPPSRLQALALLATYAAVNGATAWLFVARPFTWPDGSEARFLW